DQPVEDIATMDERISDSLGPRRFSMQLLSLFAAIALLLAAVGTYGVVSYSVAQRTAEIGLRVALGAQPSNVFTMILGKAVILTVVGTAVGTSVSLAVVRLLGTWVFGISPSDPWSFLIAVVVLALAALFASYIPARRATKVDPMVALRYE
ncbi:MAG: permease, partial [Acidobacteria bacterium]